MSERDFEGKTSTRVLIREGKIAVKHAVHCPEDEFDIEVQYSADEARALAKALLLKADELDGGGVN